MGRIATDSRTKLDLTKGVEKFKTWSNDLVGVVDV